MIYESKLTQTVFEMAKELKQQRAEAENELYSEIARCNDEIKEIRSAMKAARDANNTTAYHDAKRKRLECEDAIEMYTKNLEELQNKTLIPDDQFKELYAGLMNEANVFCNDAKNKIYELYQQADEIGKDIMYEINEINEGLRVLQIDLSRNPYPDVDGLPKRYNKDGAVINYAKYGMKHYLSKDIEKQRSNK